MFDCFYFYFLILSTYAIKARQSITHITSHPTHSFPTVSSSPFFCCCVNIMTVSFCYLLPLLLLLLPLLMMLSSSSSIGVRRKKRTTYRKWEPTLFRRRWGPGLPLHSPAKSARFASQENRTSRNFARSPTPSGPESLWSASIGACPRLHSSSFRLKSLEISKYVAYDDNDIKPFFFFFYASSLTENRRRLNHFYHLLSLLMMRVKYSPFWMSEIVARLNASFWWRLPSTNSSLYYKSTPLTFFCITI